MEETLKALQKLKVDCLYAKSTHFNAARRTEKEANHFKYWLIGASIIAFVSIVMNLGIWEKIQGEPDWMEMAANILGTIASGVILYTTTFTDYQAKLDRATVHQKTGNSLNLVFKRIRNTEASVKDGLIVGKELKALLDGFSGEYITITEAAPITKFEDYKQAKKDVRNGNLSDYTEKELNA